MMINTSSWHLHTSAFHLLRQYLIIWTILPQSSLNPSFQNKAKWAWEENIRTISFKVCIICRRISIVQSSRFYTIYNIGSFLHLWLLWWKFSNNRNEWTSDWLNILKLSESIWQREDAGGERYEPCEGGGQEQREPQPLQRGPGQADHRGDAADVGAEQVCVNPSTFNGLLIKISQKWSFCSMPGLRWRRRGW